MIEEHEAIGTDLFRRTMAWADANEDEERAELMHKVWRGTPWMVNAYTGNVYDGREREVMEWCRENFGPEAWPIHGKPGEWHRGGATINGWTWMGFATEEMMNQFCERWGDAPDKEELCTKK